MAKIKTRIKKLTPADEGPVRVVIYVRVSSRNQDIENSADAQVAECKAYIEERGWVLVGIYIDRAKSGRDDSRPQHNLMVHDGLKQDRDFDKVVMWKFDRYARHADYAQMTKAMLRRNGVELIALKDPPTDGPLGRVIEALLDTLAEIQSDGIAENVKRGTRHLARQGFFLGSKAPYGFKVQRVPVGDREHQKLAIDPETSKVVRAAFDHALDSKSINYIIRDFYAKGIPSPDGLPKWNPATISGMLHNEHYTGTIVWSANTDDEDGAVIYPNAHPGIVTQDEYDRVQRILAARQYKPKEPDKGANPRQLGSSYLLSGIITCQLCGATVRSRPAKDGGYAYYSCKTRIDFTKNVCDCPHRRSTTLEAIVMAKIHEDILGEDNITRIIEQVQADTTRFEVDYEEQMAALDKRLALIDQRRDRALEAFEMGTITREKYLERMNVLNDDRQRLEQEKADAEAIAGEEAIILTNPESVSDHAAQVRGFLEAVEPSEWKPIIRTFVQNVSIGHETGTITYKIPLPDDDPFARRMTSTIDLSGKVLSSVKPGPPGYTLFRISTGKLSLFVMSCSPLTANVSGWVNSMVKL